jgi:hypothetical protein
MYVSFTWNIGIDQKIAIIKAMIAGLERQIQKDMKNNNYDAIEYATHTCKHLHISIKEQIQEDLEYKERQRVRREAAEAAKLALVTEEA